MVQDKIVGRKAPRTKTGCWTCRERKVRCDEQKPTCSNCLRLSLTCAGYGARITFRDDTPRVISRMEPVTDLAGCAVYDYPQYPQHDSQGHSGLQYKTYTPEYFEKHKDIEIETELLDSHAHMLSPTENSAIVAHGHYSQSQSSRRSSYSHDPSQTHPWSAQRSPMPSPVQDFRQPSYQHRPQTLYGYSQPFSQHPPHHRQMEEVAMNAQQGPKIVIESTNHVHPPHGQPYSDNASHSHKSHLFAPPMRERRPTISSEASDYKRESLGQQWTETTYVARPPPSETSEAEQEAVAVPIPGTPKELRIFVNNLTPGANDPKDDEQYLDHYFTSLASELTYPERGENNPFRILMISLCPKEPALFHAVLAYAATDMAYNTTDVDSAKAFIHATRHYDAACEVLMKQLEDVRHEQSTAALATVYFLHLTDVKNAKPLAHVDTLMRIVKARAMAGRIYEGGICWTWFNATIGVLSALFGGPRTAMPYLIENEQLPTPGQGNMFPFIKKTEEERIEHTIVSPIYALQLKLWVIMSKLSCLANKEICDGWKDDVSILKIELESTWENRAKLVDDLIKDRVEKAFVSRWRTGVPAAQNAAVTYHTTRLYIELLIRGSFTHGQLMTSVQTIYRIFAKIHDAGDVFKRRYILIPVFLCSILSPEMIQKRQIFERLEESVSTERSWNKALEISKQLMREEPHCAEGPGKGFGTISWEDIRKKLDGITLY